MERWHPLVAKKVVRTGADTPLPPPQEKSCFSPGREQQVSPPCCLFLFPSFISFIRCALGFIGLDVEAGHCLMLNNVKCVLVDM